MSMWKHGFEVPAEDRASQEVWRAKSEGTLCCYSAASFSCASRCASSPGLPQRPAPHCHPEQGYPCLCQEVAGWPLRELQIGICWRWSLWLHSPDILVLTARVLDTHHCDLVVCVAPQPPPWLQRQTACNPQKIFSQSFGSVVAPDATSETC